MARVETKTKKVLDLLQRYEAANMLWVAPDDSWPIVWERAKGMNVWDAEGRKYLDLTAAFGVAAAGHANPRVTAAGAKQLKKLAHAMGDVHPHALKAELARKLSEVTFGRWTNDELAAKTMFVNSGFEAVEAALKTAVLAGGRNEIIAFTGAYHGLGYGALNATHRGYFRDPFRSQLGHFGRFVPFPRETESLDETESRITRLLKTKKTGAILVEPIQGRGGVNIPPPGFLPLLRKLCDKFGALLILDEIFTGFGRTGKWFACEHSAVVPDIICLGKALTGGFPLSACVGKADVMDAAWPASEGEAMHTSTFQGHPVGCAMALAQIQEIESWSLPERSAELGMHLIDLLKRMAQPDAHSSRSRRREESPTSPLKKFETPHVVCYGMKMEVRGRGLMIGLEIRQPNGDPAAEMALDLVKKMLHRGFILLPEGEFGNVISFSPPLTISRAQLDATVAALREVLP